MGLFTGSTHQRSAVPTNELLPGRPAKNRGRTYVTPANALRQSAVWAALRLRADMVSTLPIDVFRKVKDTQVEVPKPPVLTSPSTTGISMREWLYSTQIDLDRVGNAFGIIREKDALGNPSKIDLVAHSDVVVVVKDDVVSYRIKGTKYDADEIWHEKQFTLPGLAVGLSPVAHAAWSLGLWESSMQFGLEWFTNNGRIPSGVLKNVQKILQRGEAQQVKEQYKATLENGDIFVTGKDWEFDMKTASSSDARFLESQKYSDIDAVRFFGVPGDLIEVDGNRAQITYANVTQRNLQFLIINLGPAIVRREDALTRMVAAPRFVKLNTDAFLRMDPISKSKQLVSEIAGRLTAPSEARALLNRPPFTPDQIAEFEILNIAHALPPAEPTTPATNGENQ